MLDATGGRGADVVFDSVGSTWAESLQAAARGGRVVAFGATGGTEVTVPVRPLYLEWKSIVGTTLGSRNDFAAVLRLFRTSTWGPVVDSVFPLADASAAQERLAGDHFGKIVLQVSN